jgi:hypothetical protein
VNLPDRLGYPSDPAQACGSLRPPVPGANRITRVTGPRFSQYTVHGAMVGDMADRNYRLIVEGALIDNLDAANDGMLLTRAEGNSTLRIPTTRRPADRAMPLRQDGAERS